MGTGIHTARHTWARRAALAIAGVGALAAAQAQAAIPVYGNPNTENPALYTFTAAADGELVAYFAGNHGSFRNTLGVLVNGVNTGILGLDSLASAPGTQLSFGNVLAGSVLTFFIRVDPDGEDPDEPGNEWFVYSDRALNDDGVNHVFSADYAGGDFGMPAGTYVSFEDLPDGGDFNYTDLDFVFTNVATQTSTPAVPEPGTWAMMILGLGVVGATMRRKDKAPRLRLA